MRNREDPEIRRVKQGVLNNAFPKARRDLAKAAILEKRNQGTLTKMIVKPFHFCIYPYSEINVMGWCD